jgi:hypothetical protein
MVHLRVSSRTILVLASWKSGNAVIGGSDRGACRDRGIRATSRIAWVVRWAAVAERYAFCNERDCHPVASRVNHETEDEAIQANGAWYPVEYGKVLPFSSPDGGYHACWGNAAGRPNFRRIILPAWPASASKRPRDGSATGIRDE